MGSIPQSIFYNLCAHLLCPVYCGQVLNSLVPITLLYMFVLVLAATQSLLALVTWRIALVLYNCDYKSLRPVCTYYIELFISGFLCRVCWLNGCIFPTNVASSTFEGVKDSFRFTWLLFICEFMWYISSSRTQSPCQTAADCCFFFLSPILHEGTRSTTGSKVTV